MAQCNVARIVIAVVTDITLPTRRTGGSQIRAAIRAFRGALILNAPPASIPAATAIIHFIDPPMAPGIDGVIAGAMDGAMDDFAGDIIDRKRRCL